MSSTDKKLDTIIEGIAKIIQQLDFFINFNQNINTEMEEADEEEDFSREFKKVNLNKSQISRK